MAWLRQAGVGVAITSWWGQGDFTDKAVPLLLRMGQRYGIKIAFHIEPYELRSATQVVDDISYVYRRYGSDPAFFRMNSATRYSKEVGAKGVFFVWCVDFPGLCGTGQRVETAYWRSAMDQVHALPGGALVIANSTDARWISDGHFDGLYNYVTLDLGGQAFSWARSIPPGALYVPSVTPGFSARRVEYPPAMFLARRDGATFDEQWTAALGTGVRPDLVTNHLVQ